MAHDSECEFKEIKCRNNCGTTFKRKFELEHFDECELQYIQCPYHSFGCRTEVLRMNYMNHLKNEALGHSIMFIEGQEKKNNEIQELKQEMGKMKDEFRTKLNEIMSVIGLQNKQQSSDGKS